MTKETIVDKDFDDLLDYEVGGRHMGRSLHCYPLD